MCLRCGDDAGRDRLSEVTTKSGEVQDFCRLRLRKRSYAPWFCEAASGKPIAPVRIPPQVRALPFSFHAGHIARQAKRRTSCWNSQRLTLPLAAAGWAFLYMLCGGGLGGAILIFIASRRSEVSVHSGRRSLGRASARFPRSAAIFFSGRTEIRGSLHLTGISRWSVPLIRRLVYPGAS